jgi:hypothetical protein
VELDWKSSRVPFDALDVSEQRIAVNRTTAANKNVELSL